MPGISRFLLCLSIISCLLGLPCLGQEFRGTIAGRVADAQDAVVPNVRIVATRVETGAKYETVSGADGQYTLPFVAPGQYRLVAEAGGFKRYVREGLGVSTNEHLSADIKLELGQLTESVTVVADSPLLETGTASVGQVINARQIESMPMNGRSPFIAAQLSFGVAFTGDPSSRTKAFDNSRQSAFTMGGAPSGKNEFLWNGTPDTDSDGLVAYVPPLDAVVEVKVQTFQADAAYGNSGGGTLLLLSKSGTNDLHGTAYEFNAASALAATPFFTNSSGQRKGVARYEPVRGYCWRPGDNSEGDPGAQQGILLFHLRTNPDPERRIQHPDGAHRRRTQRRLFPVARGWKQLPDVRSSDRLPPRVASAALALP